MVQQSLNLRWWSSLHVQVVHSPYKGISDCVMRMLREEGVGAFYKSYRTTVRARFPFYATWFQLCAVETLSAYRHGMKRALRRLIAVRSGVKASAMSMRKLRGSSFCHHASRLAANMCCY